MYDEHVWAWRYYMQSMAQKFIWEQRFVGTFLDCYHRDLINDPRNKQALKDAGFNRWHSSWLDKSEIKWWQFWRWLFRPNGTRTAAYGVLIPPKNP